PNSVRAKPAGVRPTNRAPVGCWGRTRKWVFTCQSPAMTVIRACLFSLLAIPLVAQTADHLVGKNVSLAQTNFKGHNAAQVIATPGAVNATSLAVVKDASFRDGTIEVDLAGQPAAGADGAARGFIGIAFRLQDDGSYEYIYLRPTNGRADD